MMSKIRRAGVIALTIIATVCFAASLFWLKDVATVKAETANNSYMVMQDGASARLGGENNGLRFTTLVDKTFYDELSAATVEIGTVIIPSDLLGENLLTLETAEAKKTVLAQEKCALKDFSETQYSYGGVLVDVKDGNLMREFTGRGYILVDEGLDTEAVYYAEQADNSRSVMYVLSAFLAAGTGEAEDVAYAEEKIAAATARIETAVAGAALQLSVNGQPVTDGDSVEVGEDFTVSATFGGYDIAVRTEMSEGDLVLTAKNETVGAFAAEGFGESTVQFGIAGKSVAVKLVRPVLGTLDSVGTLGNFASLYPNAAFGIGTLNGASALELTIPEGTELPNSLGEITFSIKLPQTYNVGAVVCFDWETENATLNTVATGYNNGKVVTNDIIVTKNAAFCITTKHKSAETDAFRDILFYLQLNRGGNNAEIENGVLLNDIVIRIANLKITPAEEFEELGAAVYFDTAASTFVSDPSSVVRIGEMSDGAKALEIVVMPEKLTNNNPVLWFNLPAACKVGSIITFRWEVENMPLITYVYGFNGSSSVTSEASGTVWKQGAPSLTTGLKDGATSDTFDKVYFYFNLGADGFAVESGKPIVLRITAMEIAEPVA